MYLKFATKTNDQQQKQLVLHPNPRQMFGRAAAARDSDLQVISRGANMQETSTELANFKISMELRMQELERCNDLNRLEGERLKEIALEANTKAEKNETKLATIDLAVVELNETTTAQKTQIADIKDFETKIESNINVLNLNRTADNKKSDDQLQDLRTKVRRQTLSQSNRIKKSEISTSRTEKILMMFAQHVGLDMSSIGSSQSRIKVTKKKTNNKFQKDTSCQN